MIPEIYLRKWTMADLVKYANDPLVAGKLTDRFPHPYTEADGIVFIQMAAGLEPAQIFAIVVNGIACGGIGIHPQTDIHRKSAELGYWLGREFWGRGIMAAAISEIVPYAFNTFDIDRIFARPFGSNKASQRVLEKCGFALEARFHQTLIKNGAPEDEWVYAMRRNG